MKTWDEWIDDAIDLLKKARGACHDDLKAQHDSRAWNLTVANAACTMALDALPPVPAGYVYGAVQEQREVKQ